MMEMQLPSTLSLGDTTIIRNSFSFTLQIHRNVGKTLYLQHRAGKVILINIFKKK